MGVDGQMRSSKMLYLQDLFFLKALEVGEFSKNISHVKAREKWEGRDKREGCTQLRLLISILLYY